MKKIQITEEQTKEIIELYNSGFGQIKISRKLGFHYSIISRILKENNITLSIKKYKVDENFFEKIDTEEKAYWLGFLFADGYVRLRKFNSGELKLKLQIKDKHHIEKFKDNIKSNNIIKDVMEKYRYKGEIKQSMSSMISIYSNKLVNDLIKIGCHERKTRTIRFPDNLDYKLYNHFIRGYFDGDGCIHLDKKNNIKFYISCGSYQFLNDLMIIFNDIGITHSKITEKSKNNYRLEIYRINDLKLVYTYFYNKSIVFMDRKEIIFNNVNKK